MAKLNVNFISYTLKRAVDITVVLPSVTIPESLGMGLEEGEKPTHKLPAKFPVLYLLHGYGNNHATWSGYANVELYAEERQIAVVMFSTENKFYSNVGDEDKYYDFVLELQEYIENTFPISTRVEDTYIAGLSMGGYGSLLHGLTRSERFNAVGSFSGAVGNARGDFDLLAHVQKMIDDKTPFPSLYIACGTDDFLYQANLDFVKLLEDNHIPVTTDYIEGYGHEWRFWNIQVEKYLDWIPRTDYYATKKRKV